MQFTKSFAVLAAFVCAANAVTVTVNAPTTISDASSAIATLNPTTLPVGGTTIISPLTTITIVGSLSTTSSSSTSSATGTTISSSSSSSSTGTSSSSSSVSSSSSSSSSASPTSTAGTYPNIVRVHHPKQSANRYCARWNSACINYRPTRKTLKFQSTSCTPGDFNGNYQNHVAITSCMFATPEGQTQNVNRHVSQNTGAYIY